MPTPTKRGFGMAMGSALLFLIGTNIQSGWLFVLASLLLGAAVAGYLMAPAMVRGVVVQRRAPSQIHAGDDAGVDLVISNPSRRTLLSLNVADEHIAPVTVFVPRVGPGETIIAATTRHAVRRGIVDAEPVTVSSRAPFGSGTARRRVAAPGRTVVFPRVVPVTWLPDLASAAKPLQAALVQARKGTGHDFIGVRDYRPGDPMRHIHWPSSARRGSLTVREFEQELPRRLGVVLDTSADSSGQPESVLDLCCSVGGSVGLHALELGQPLALAAAGSNGMASFDGSDTTDAMTWLAALRPDGRMALPEAVRAAAPLLGRLDTLVVCVPTWRTTAADDLCAALTAFEGIQIIAVLIEAHTFDGTPRGLAMSVTAIDALAESLDASDVAVIRVGAHDDLGACLAGL